MANGKTPRWQYVAKPLVLVIATLVDNIEAVAVLLVLGCLAVAVCEGMDKHEQKQRECHASTCSSGRVPVMFDKRCVCMEAANGKR
jgi:hypothetical protein